MNYLHKNRKGQGTTEYIVILALIIAAVVILWPTINGALTKKTQTLAGQIEK